MINNNISQASYVLDETYYLFSDNRLSKRYLAHIMANSSNVDEVIRRIKRIQDRVITLSNYATDNIDRLNDYADDNIANLDKKEVNFEKIDNFFNNDTTQNDFGEYLKTQAPQTQLLSVARQCEFIRISCEQMIKQTRCYYLGLREHEKTQKAISDKQLSQRKSIEMGIYRNLKAD